ncbi:hypothetical protein TNCV_4139761 [Trichonephila clavipes]|nr:hypothetical protein TNCV_4139761 [Trichonephila clavipes]
MPFTTSSPLFDKLDSLVKNINKSQQVQLFGILHWTTTSSHLSSSITLALNLNLFRKRLASQTSKSLVSAVGISNRNLAGVIGVRSYISSDRYVNGRELRTFSHSHRMVSNSSYVNMAFSKVLLRSYFTVLTSISQRPPHQAAVGGINFHVIHCTSAYRDTLFQSI